MTKTFIAMIVDETGSMSHRRQTAIDSTNEFITAHAEIEECYASVVTFDKRYGDNQHSVRFLQEGVAIKDVTPLSEENYNPRGMTNLNDAIGETIKHMEDVTKHQDEPTVIVMINTDGDENGSTEFTDKMIKDMIAEKKDLGWEFVFIAEELSEADARRMSATRGISADMMVNVSGSNKAAMFADMAAATTAYAGAKGAMGPQGPRGAQGDAGVTLSSYMKNIATGDAE